jgi:GH25 family lysozyme M1 (1,4-beta-N-acetylmuramidase)
MAKGIDVSHWQGVIDWLSVKESGIEFAILKAGGSDDGFYTDSTFEQNYKEAKAVGLPVGAYYFVGSLCTSRADGIADAKRFLEIIKGKSFEYPVYIDLESTNPAAKAGATEACIGFCETMEAAGYYCGIYASDISGFRERLDISKLERFDKWVAIYGSKPNYVKSYGVWQYSSTGKVSGIIGNVDMNEAYKDYPQIIKAAGLNGFKKPEPAPEPVPEPEKKTIKTSVTIDGKTYTGTLTEE